jgi:hypothetical protein
MFPANTTFWQNRCAGTSTEGGCYRPKILYNAANGNYVFWFNQAPGNLTSSANALFVFTCTTPYSGCIKQTDPSGLAHPNSGDFGLFLDTGGTAYIVYTDLSGGFELYIDKLNANFTDSTGTTVDLGINQREAVSMFTAGGTYFVLSSSRAAFGAGDTSYQSASTVMGTYSGLTQLNANSCGGQHRSVDTIIKGGSTTYLLSSDEWTGAANEATANIFFYPLAFGAGSINTFTCSQTVTVPGVTLGPNPSNYPTPDQSTSPTVGFLAWDDISTTMWRMQTFVPTQSTLMAVIMPLGQQANFGSLNGNATVSLVTLDGSNNPVTTLATQTITAAQLSWAADNVTLEFNLTGLSIGTPYGLLVKSAGSAGNVGIGLFTGSSSPASSGIERYSTNSGSTWNTESGRALMFATYPPIAATGPGRARP